MHELVLRVPQDLVEAVSDQLMDELDALSVSVEDADAGTMAERALFSEGAARRHWWTRKARTRGRLASEQCARTRSDLGPTASIASNAGTQDRPQIVALS